VHLLFENLVTGDRQEGSPVSFLRVSANALQTGPDLETVASFRDGQWASQRATPTVFPVLRIAGPVTLSFEEGELSETYGPFDSVLLISGLLRHGEEPNAILARLDHASGCWEVGSERRRYGTLVLEAP
jgi:hypothetical protein